MCVCVPHVCVCALTIYRHVCVLLLVYLFIYFFGQKETLW